MLKALALERILVVFAGVALFGGAAASGFAVASPDEPPSTEGSEESTQQSYCYVDREIEGTVYDPSGDAPLANRDRSQLWFSSTGAGAALDEMGNWTEFTPGARYYELDMPTSNADLPEWMLERARQADVPDDVEILQWLGETIFTSHEFCTEGAELMQALTQLPWFDQQMVAPAGEIIAFEASHPTDGGLKTIYRLYVQQADLTPARYEVWSSQGDAAAELMEVTTVHAFGVVDAVGLQATER